MKEPQNSSGLEVGEVDTRAPFQSVKDAVSLFGEVRKEKPRRRISKSSEEITVLHNETLLHLAEKQLNRLKEQLRNAENTTAGAHFDLEKSRRTQQDLNCKLKTVTESRNLFINATEAAKNRAKQLEEVPVSSLNLPSILSPVAWSEQLMSEREQYGMVSNEVAIIKQELRNIQQGFDLFLEAKILAFQQAADAQHAFKTNKDKVCEMAKDVAAMRDSLSHVKMATGFAIEEQIKISKDRDALQMSHTNALQGVESKLLALRKDFNLKFTGDLEAKLGQVFAEIEMVREEIRSARDLDDSAMLLNLEIDRAKMAQQRVNEDEGMLRSLVKSLKAELEASIKAGFGLRESESSTRNLSAECEKARALLETTRQQENQARIVLEEMVGTLDQLWLESKHARQQIEEIKPITEQARLEACNSCTVKNNAEKELEFLEREVREAKAAEKSALDGAKFSFSGNDALNCDAEKMMKLETETFESMTRKVEECQSMAEERLENAMTEMEEIRVRENEARKDLEDRSAKMIAMDAATKEALKKVEMSEAAMQALEGELKRRRLCEKKDKASEIREAAPETSRINLL